MPEWKERLLKYCISLYFGKLWWISTYFYCKISGCDYAKQLPCLEYELVCYVKALRSSIWRNVWTIRIDYLSGYQLDEIVSSLTTTSRLQLLFEIYMWCLLLTYNLSDIELLWYTLSHSLCIKIPHRPFSSIGINALAYSRPFHSNLHCIALTKFLKYLLPWTEYQCCSKVCRELGFQRMLRKFKWKIDGPPRFIGRVLRLSLNVPLM